MCVPRRFASFHLHPFRRRGYHADAVASLVVEMKKRLEGEGGVVVLHCICILVVPCTMP